MSETEEEKLLSKYPLPVTIDDTEAILKQMKYSICIIENKKGNGTGFFCQILNKKLLITNNHIIDEGIIKKNDIINVALNDNKIRINLKIIDFYSSREYDTTIIEINKIDNNNDNANFLEIDNNIFDENFNLYNQCIYIIQYPKCINNQKAAVSYGISNGINSEYNLMHYCCTDHGSSGSPIIKLSNKKIIGIHKKSSKTSNYNIGTFLKYPFKEYIDNHKSKIYLKNLIQPCKEKEYMKKPIQKKEYLLTPIQEKKNLNQTIQKKENMILPQKSKENNIIIPKTNEIKLKVKIEQKDINKNIFLLDNFNQAEHCHDNLKELNELITLGYKDMSDKMQKKYRKSEKYLKKQLKCLNEGSVLLKFNFNSKGFIEHYYIINKIRDDYYLSIYKTISDSKPYKMINLEELNNITIGFKSKNLINKIKDEIYKGYKPWHFLSLWFPDRTIDLYFDNDEEMNKWFEGIYFYNRYIIENKKMRGLNYFFLNKLKLRLLYKLRSMNYNLPIIKKLKHYESQNEVEYQSLPIAKTLLLYTKVCQKIGLIE